MFQLNDLSRYRSQLMGVATIMIIVCHAAASKVLMPTMLSGVFGWGNYGVDIFMFLSGLGCFYSLSKTNGSYLSFCKRRLWRILPAYLIVFIPLNILYLAIGERGVVEALLSITTLEYWMFHKGAWFISIIIPLYIISPLFFKAFETKWKWCWMTGLIAAIMVLCAIPLKDNSNTSLFHNIQFALSRVPSFIWGMAIANGCKLNKKISILWPLLLVFLLFIPLRIFLPSIFWGWLVVPFFLVLFAMVIKWMKHCYWVDKFLTFMGTISLESYLLNISINALLSVLIIHFSFSGSPLLYGNFLQYSIVVIVGTLLSFVINKICKSIIF